MRPVIKRAITRSALVLTLAVTLSGTMIPPASSGGGFEVHVSRISRDLKERMTGKSWHEGCPVPIGDLRLIRVSYRNYGGERHMGKLVVHRDAVDAIVYALRSIWRHDVRIHRMHLIDRYDGSDDRSMDDDNTSAFNCRNVAGTNRWSEHAYGRAIDINPLRNPYVGSDGSVSPEAGRRYADRSRHAKGMIHSGDSTVRAFARQGWGWGGNWSSSKDYQHFSASGS
jgi:hypothetical protein